MKRSAELEIDTHGQDLKIKIIIVEESHNTCYRWKKIIKLEEWETKELRKMVSRSWSHPFSMERSDVKYTFYEDKGDFFCISIKEDNKKETYKFVLTEEQEYLLNKYENYNKSPLL